MLRIVHVINYHRTWIVTENSAHTKHIWYKGTETTGSYSKGDLRFCGGAHTNANQVMQTKALCFSKLFRLVFGEDIKAGFVIPVRYM
jgi:hypothetical protein